MTRYDIDMAIGDSLNWFACPPVIRKQVRNYVLGAILFSIAALLLVLLRDRLGIPREPWGRYGPLALGLVPLLVLWPMFLLGRRRLRADFIEARGRLCTHCGYNLTSKPDQGICPECGNTFDTHADAAMWNAAGFKCDEIAE